MAFDRSEFDLFAFLGQLSKRDPEAYNKLSEEGKKQAHPFVIMRWLTGTSDQAQIVRINEFVNPYVFKNPDKEFLFKLLAAACTGNTNRYKWIKGPSTPSSKLSISVIMGTYNVSSREAQDYLQFLNATDLTQFAEDLGWAKEEIKKLTVELGKDDIEPGRPKKLSKKSKN